MTVSRNALVSGTAFAALMLFQASGAQAACAPTIEGPIAVTATSKPYMPKGDVTPPEGTHAEEFFVSCDVSGGHYKTLIHVTLPTDPKRQSGIVIEEPWHPGDFFTIYDKAKHYIARSGHVSVVVVASNAVLTSYHKKGDPERYASLALPGPAERNAPGAAADTTQSEVLGQVGAFIKSGGIPGVKARKVILGGMSMTGAITRAYIAWEHAKPGVKSTFDGYFPEQSAGFTAPLQDLDVPVVEIDGEREVIWTFESGADHLRYRRADGPLYRLYEVAGAPHIATRDKIEPGVPDCVGHTWTNFPTDMIFGMALDHLVQWVDKGVPAPHMPRLDTSPDGSIIHRDQFGNALGGVRTSYLDVPVATYHANWGHYVTTSTGPSDALAAKCDQIGWTNPLPPENLKRLYPTHADYVAKVKKSTADLVKRGMLLSADAAALNSEAEQAQVP
jgi:hypothetical protein